MYAENIRAEKSCSSLSASLEDIIWVLGEMDRLCGLVVRVLGYRSGGPGFDSRHYDKKSSESGTGSTQPRGYN
jgi:hypothetical protein